MKRKILSLTTAILSLGASALYVVIGILYFIRVSNGKSFVPEVEDSFWIVEVINRVSKAGFNVFFSIVGVILAGILATYRVTLAYFYYKVYRGDDKFYKERLSEIIFFAIIAFIMVFVSGYLVINREKFLPSEIQIFPLVLFVVYLVLFLLPIVELVTVLISNALKTESEEVGAITKDGIVEELDELANKSVDEKIIQSKIENGVETLSEEEASQALTSILSEEDEEPTEDNCEREVLETAETDGEETQTETTDDEGDENGANGNT